MSKEDNKIDKVVDEVIQSEYVRLAVLFIVIPFAVAFVVLVIASLVMQVVVGSKDVGIFISFVIAVIAFFVTAYKMKNKKSS